jgi:hypothetical protein
VSWKTTACFGTFAFDSEREKAPPDDLGGAFFI